ncbi:MAG TPA: hypothetical protein DCM49_07070 [Lachnospiraceae bacterium]|nr:hypothetical protein [Lachnospiraceae bacterium]
MDHKVKVRENRIMMTGLAVCIAAALACSGLMLGNDAPVFIKWYLMMLIMGCGIFPAAKGLFKAFADRGWIFCKVLSAAAAGYLTWAAVCFEAVPFTGSVCRLAAAFVLILTAGGKFVIRKKHFFLNTEREDADDASADAEFSGPFRPGISWKLILSEEILFLLLFLMWAYIMGFRPEAFGTEKFMDFGFLKAMMRSRTLPAADIWYAGKNINYYYGGQYFAAFFTKLSGTEAEQTYNLSRAMIASFAFMMPFSLVWNMIMHRLKKNSPASAAGGVLAGAAVSLAGNMHYVIYGLSGPVFKMKGYKDYWFPDSTRFIGYNPATSDQCIHEFPSYSFVLGDLHAHVFNIIFVLLVTGLLYAWLCQACGRGNAENNDENEGKIPNIVHGMLQPHILICGWLVGMFQWTNYWDFIIYLTVIFLVLIMYEIWCRPKKEASPGYRIAYGICGVLIRGSEVFVIASLAAVPFRMSFEMMVSGIAKANVHTPLYQLAILWGLPAAVFFVYLFILVKEGRSSGRGPAGIVFDHELPDMFAFLLGCCGAGLVMIPELVYVRDIYEEYYPRANTMFKLTYQAFIMFGIMTGYVLIRNMCEGTRKNIWRVPRIISQSVLLFLLLLTFGYFPYSVSEWYGDIKNASGYLGQDALAYLEEQYPQDASALRWLDGNTEGNPVILEADGDSYSVNCRVSAMTGLPTVMGWYVHEWLWRGDVDSLNQRRLDISAVYTSDDPEEVMSLLKKYGVEYIFVGSCEYEKYPEINKALLAGMGKIVFDSSDDKIPGSGAYIVKVSSGDGSGHD